MVKIQDGSLVPASELLSGAGEDDEGNKLEFKSVKEASIPTYRVERKMDDGTGRTRVYQFSFDDTNVTVHQSFIEPESEKAAAPEKKEVKEVHPAAAAASESKKNMTVTSKPSDQLGLNKSKK